MDSVGSILKGAREEKNIALNQVSSDTHILPGYILAIEENRFQDLPGEAYCAGFIGTLAKYYGLDSAHLVSQFRGVPVEKAAKQAPVIMTEKSKKAPLIMILVALAVLASILLFVFAGRKAPEPEVAPVVQQPKANVYVMDEVLFERSFAENDIVQVQMGSDSYDIVCKSIGNSVVLEYRKGNVTLSPDGELVLDLDGDTKKDVKISLNDVDPQARTAVIRINRAIEAPVPPPLPTVPIASKPESVIMHDKGSLTVLVSPVKRNFAFEVVFSGPCYFRYQADGAPSVENYFKAGDKVSFEVADSVKVWLSNAGNAKILLGESEITLGQKGDVTSEIIGWEETQDKAFNLTIVSMH